MIRNIVVVKLRPGAAREDAEAALAAIAALQPEGCLEVTVGLDAGLRDGNWSCAITSDFVDADAYRRYDADEEHNRVRREMFAPISQEIVRVQLEV